MSKLCRYTTLTPGGGGAASFSERAGGAGGGGFPAAVVKDARMPSSTSCRAFPTLPSLAVRITVLAGVPFSRRS